MARPAKPVDTLSAHRSNKEIEVRRESEEKLKGKRISNKPPSNLNKKAKGIYVKLLEQFPDGFLTESDSINIEILAQTILMLYTAQKDIDKNGLIVNGKPNYNVTVYEKCTKIIDSYGKKLGMSPRDRAALGYMMFEEEQEKDDDLLKILQG